MKKVKRRAQEEKKIKILTLGDHPLLPSGVGTQSKYVFEALLKTKKFQIVSMGGAINHNDHNKQTVSPWGEDFVIYPVDGYGDENVIRSVIRSEKPDIVWFMTDPRFYEWLWNIENEIRPNMPMVYYHVWDNFPAPKFNKPFYDSTDVIVSISKLTDDIVNEVSSDTVDKYYIPHAVNQEIFKPLSKEVVDEFKEAAMPFLKEDDFVFFWNNRNARRKQSGSLLFWFKEALSKNDNLKLIMHTDPKDPNGQDLVAIISELELQGKVYLSQDKVPPENLALLYNAVDCTINISDAEGFGLATLESLACGTPIIVNKTGGLQDQITTKAGAACGIGLDPSSRAVIGSQQVPWIYEDRLDQEKVVAAILDMAAATPEQYAEWSSNGLAHVDEFFNFEKFEKKWVKVMKDTHRKYGSWPNKKYNSWKFTEIK